MCGSFLWSRPCTLPYRGGSHMRKWIGSALLLAAVAFIPAQLVAQRRPAARPAARAQPPQFAAELNWSSDADFGIGGRGVFGLQSLFPKVPLDGIVSFDYFFPSAPSGVSAHYWEINGNVAYRFRVPARSSLAPYGRGPSTLWAGRVALLAGGRKTGSRRRSSHPKGWARHDTTLTRGCALA